MNGVIFSEDWFYSKSEVVICSLNKYLFSTNYVAGTGVKVAQKPSQLSSGSSHLFSNWAERQCVLALRRLPGVTFLSSESNDKMLSLTRQ